METPVSFGEWLKHRRKMLDLTQEELANRASCSVFALRKIESGERRPSKQLAATLAAALEISKQEQPTFIRVARGEWILERLHAPKIDKPLGSISDLAARVPVVSLPVEPDLKPVTAPLPLPPTPLLGRDSELAALVRLFKAPECRLLTLTGMGGIGKTRLAIEFATCNQDLFSDGVFYVPLAPINSFESIIPAIAEVLQFPFSGPVDLKEQLIKHLSARIKSLALLVLDNLEHLIAQSSGTAELVAELLQRLPHLKVLTTSRERLNLQGEWMYELHGLPVPPEEFVAQLDDYSATALFIHKAHQIRNNFKIEESEKNDLVHICRLLDGVPLAIELAAAWAGILTCSEIASEIEANIDFLSTTIRDMPERHRSLRATFDHSWKLLSTQERAVLAKLAVFRGGFDRSAAEKVAGASLPLLASLVSKSLVRRAETGRYDLHEVIRQYAVSHLEEDMTERNETCDRHSEHFLKFVSEREKALKSAAQQDAIRELMRETDNIRAAWAWAIHRERIEWLGESVRALGWMFEVAGLLREGIDQLQQLIYFLKHSAQNNHWQKVLGAALVQQALLYFRKGQFLPAQDLYRESIEILRPIGEQVLLAHALVLLGIITHLNGEYDKAQSLLQEGLACAQAGNDPWIAAFAVLNLGYVDSQRGLYVEGYQQMLKGLEEWRAVGDPHSISMGLNFMVPTLIHLGHFEEAKASMYESIALCEQTRNRWGLGTAYRFLGLVLAEQGQYPEAKTQFEKSLEIFSEQTEGWDIARTISYLGNVTLQTGGLSEAREYYREALRLAIEANAIPIAMDALSGFAQLEEKMGNTIHAYRLLNFVLQQPASTDEAKDLARHLLVDVESHLTAKQKKMLQAKADTLSLEQVTNEVLKEY